MSDRERDLLEELEILLKEGWENVQLLESDELDVADLITHQLSTLGVALVKVPDVHADKINKETGANMAKTFRYLSEATKVSLSEGNFERFSEEWKKKLYSQTKISFKTNGMANKAPLDPDHRPDFTDHWTKIVHVNNRLAATNNICLWEGLTELHARLHPSEWFKDDLRPPNYRIQVSEDGVKILHKQSYEPTALHYDGQLGQAEGGDARRIQIVYTADSGPVRLFVVAGSHKPRVRQIIQAITGVPGMPGFITLKKQFDQHPQLRQLLYKYGVALPSTGLLMFRANVWHYEAVERFKTVEYYPVSVLLSPDYNSEDTKAKTKQSSIFRIYCGVVSVPPSTDNFRDLVVLAYLREHGWAIDPFSPENKKHPLFVNHKSTQNWSETSHPGRDKFQVLVSRTIPEMKSFLLEHVRPERLQLYGLSQTDLLSSNFGL